jgi:site-specific DNA-adenine methylase
MIPYVGCKQSIASEILAQMPEAEHFYDLFGGGGSITEAAAGLRHSGILGEWAKWQQVHYNELNTGVYLLNKEIWEGTFDFDKAGKIKVDKEMFERAKEDKATALSVFITIYHSYANMGLSYFNNDYKVKGYIRTTKKSKIINDILECTNKDYREVHIKPNSVVYCDIPYSSIASTKRGVYYQVKFDYAAFYEWARNAEFPVYFSDYNAPDNFLCVWEKIVECTLNFRKRSTRTEKLFWNGVNVAT